MSTLKTKNVQVGVSANELNNYTLYQKDTPDGTLRLSLGNSGAITPSDVLIINGTESSLTFIGDSYFSEVYLSSSPSSSDSAVRADRTITAGTGLSGGGNLLNDMTISIANGGVDTAQLANNAVTTVKIDNDTITNSKLANVDTGTFKGRVTSGTGDPEDLTVNQVRTLLNFEDGANNYTHPNHSGDVTSVNDGATTIASNVVTNTKLANMAGNTIKGRASTTGDPQDLTAAQARTILNVADGANNYTHPNHSGDVTSAGDGVTTIANNIVSNTKLADMATSTIKGRATSGTGDPEDLTASEARTILNVADGANNYTHPNHSGDVTSSGDGATTIVNNIVSNTKLANMAGNTIKGRASTTGDPQDLTAAQARTILNVADGATANTGTVTSVATGSGLTGGTITTTGTIAHSDTSSQSSVDNSNGSVIQDVTLDDFGHVTSLGSADLDSRYLKLSGGTLTDNLTMAAGKGIDFSAYGSGTGVDSNLFDDYEEGTWTPVYVSDGGWSASALTSHECYYTKIGNIVHLYGGFKTNGTDASIIVGDRIGINGAPFSPERTSTPVLAYVGTGFLYNSLGSSIWAHFAAAMIDSGLGVIGVEFECVAASNSPTAQDAFMFTLTYRVD